MPQPNLVHFEDWGLIPYDEARSRQETHFNGLVELKSRERNLSPSERETPPHKLIFCEHPHVYTLGKSGSPAHLLLSEEQLKAKGIQYAPTNRGGDITYHGPGQVVGYPILDLDFFFTDIHKYMRFLEEVIIRTLGEYGIESGRLEGYTGVWLEPEDEKKARKICAMGVKCSRWVTMHGWALNVNADLDYFNYIVPCGIKDKSVTSLRKELGREVNMENVKGKLCRHFAEVFGCEVRA